MSQRSTMRTIAEELGVSTGTVYRALHNTGRVSSETKVRVLQKARELNYRPNELARSLVRGVALPFAVIFPVGSADFFWSEVRRGVECAAQELHDYGVTVTCITYQGMDADSEAQALETAFQTNPIGLAIAPLRQEVYVAGFQQHDAQGRSIVVFNDDIPGVFREASVSPDMVRSGRIAGELLGKFMGGQGKAVAITGLRGRLSHVQRVEGFQREFKSFYSGIDLLPLVQFEGGEQAAYDCMVQLLSTRGDIRGVYSVDGNVGAVGRAIRDLGLTDVVKLVGHELSDEIRLLIRTDCIQAVVCQNPFQQGYRAVRTLYRIIGEKREPSADDTFCPLTIALRNTLDEPAS